MMKTLPNRILFEEARAVLQKGGTVKLRLVGNSFPGAAVPAYGGCYGLSAPGC